MTAPQRAQFSTSANVVDDFFHRGQDRGSESGTAQAGDFRRAGDRRSAGGRTDDGQSDASAVPGALPDGLTWPANLIGLLSKDKAVLQAAFSHVRSHAGKESAILNL